MNSYYLILDLICFVLPFALSFDKNVQYRKKWRYAIIAILCVAVIFIPWDIYFTHIEVWGFNEEYLLGITVFNLPLEECLFFITVPFACIFIYECVDYYLSNFSEKLERFLDWKLLVLFNLVSIGFLILYWDKFYTTIIVISALLITNVAAILLRNYIAKTLISFCFIAIPFLLVNSALTGYFTNGNPVVWYNPDTVSNIRIGTIPIEDVYYNLVLVAFSLFFYLAYQKLVLKRRVLK